MKWYRGA